MLPFDNFVYLKKDAVISGVSLKKDEIGFVNRQSGDLLSVYFMQSKATVNVEKNDVEFFDPNKTGDAYSKKVCNMCQRLLDTEKFSKNRTFMNNRIVRRPSCDDCRVEIDGVSPPRGESEKWEKKKPYLMPFECPICRKTTIPGISSKVVLDHDHKTGEIRGWICESCNTGLGRFKDDISLLQRAIDYLQKQL